MPIGTTNAYSGPYTANGVTVTFPFTFKVLSTSQVSVVIRVDGVDTTVSTGSYAVTLSGSSPSSGSVVFNTAPTSGEIYVLLSPEFSQDIEFADGAAWIAKPVNDGYDQSALRDQSLKRDVGRALLAPVGEVLAQLPLATERAGKFQAYDAAGDPVMASGTGADAALRSDIAQTSGTSLLGFIQSATGAVATTAADVLHGIITPEQFGAVGDGSTDDYTAFVNAMNAAVTRGVRLVCDGTKTYAIGPQMTFPANLMMETNGAIFLDKVTTSSNSPLFLVSSGCEFDSLRITILSGIVRDRIIRFDGNNIVHGLLEVFSADQQANTSDAADAAITYNGNNVDVGIVRVTNFDRCQRVAASFVRIGHLEQISYLRGTYITNAAYVKIESGYHPTASPNAVSISPGYNTFQIACDEIGATHDISIVDQTVLEAGEHSFRIGGPETISNVYFMHNRIRGAAACGIKVRGIDGTPVSVNNKNIWICHNIIQDCGVSSDSVTYLNRCGILVEAVTGLHVIGNKVRTYANASSASIGIRVHRCTDAEIVGNQTTNTVQDGLMLQADDADLNDVTITGHTSKSCGRFGASLLVTTGMNANSIHGTGIVCKSSGTNGLRIVNSGTLTDVVLAAQIYGTSGAVNTAVSGATDSTAVVAILDIIGGPGSKPISEVTAANSSRWADGTNTYIRKAGAWTAL